jgi:WD40 repeat protein
LIKKTNSLGSFNLQKNPVTDKYPNHLVVAENGHSPPIFVYNYPSMDVISLLKGGTSRIYTKVDHSPDGEMMVSQGGKFFKVF